METRTETFTDRLAKRGVSRRDFLKFCSIMAATLALPGNGVGRIAKALAASPRPPVVWLEFQDCTGDTESFLRTGQPTIDEFLLDRISLDYHETLMAPAGGGTERSLSATIRAYPGEYIAIVEGSIPTADGGVYCTIRGRTALSILEEVAADAWGVVAAGSCAYDGGLAAAAPNPTGAVGVMDAVPGLTNLVNLPGCPANAVNIAATLVHVLTYNAFPAVDGRYRPTFAYSREIHDHCERKIYNEHDQYVLAWGDEGHRKGWCLEKMGCRGPETHSNCYSVMWNDGTSWPIGAGHNCVGCTNASFWDRMTPFYREEDEGEEEDDD
jgi:hydrogenase small subunit